MKTNFEQKAINFAQKNNVKLRILNSTFKSMWGENQERCVFKCKLSRNEKSYTFDFGQSINNGCNEPTMYDVLSCLQKYDVGSFEEFCGEFCYDTDSRKAEKTYKALCKEFEAVNRLFGDIIDELQNIN